MNFKFKNHNIVEEAVNSAIEDILNENYKDINDGISDIRYGYYADENKYYSFSYYKFGYVSLALEKYKCLLSECTYNFLEEKIKNIFKPYIYYLKVLNCTPRYKSIVPEPIGNPRLCIYYQGCNLDGNLIEFSIGVDILYMT